MAGDPHQQTRGSGANGDGGGGAFRFVSSGRRSQAEEYGRVLERFRSQTVARVFEFVPSREIGRAMPTVARNGFARPMLESRDIVRAARGGARG